MESAYGKDKVDFGRLREACLERGVGMRRLGVELGLGDCAVNSIAAGRRVPMTDTVARICAFLGCPVTDVVEFRGIEPREYFSGPAAFRTPESPEGEVTYRPLFEFLDYYISCHPGKTEDDLFDRVGRSPATEGQLRAVRAAHEARGFGDGYVPGRVRRGLPGLSQAIRTKLRYDRPVRIGTIYEICSTLGCTPDWVMSYK